MRTQLHSLEVNYLTFLPIPGETFRQFFERFLLRETSEKPLKISEAAAIRDHRRVSQNLPNKVLEECPQEHLDKFPKQIPAELLLELFEEFPMEFLGEIPRGILSGSLQGNIDECLKGVSVELKNFRSNFEMNSQSQMKRKLLEFPDELLEEFPE